MGRVEGKVAFITGAARGQGRSHAIRLAEEGADIIAVDIAAQIQSVPYSMATPDDLVQTVKEVEALGRRIVAAEVDLRDYDATKAALDDGVAQLGRLDIVVANAGISSFGLCDTMPEQTWQDMIDVNLTSVWHSVKPAIPHIRNGGRGGSIILTSSVAGLVGVQNMTHYTAAKHGVTGMMKSMAIELAPEWIRVNTVNPGTIKTDMSHNDATYRIWAPELSDAERTEEQLYERKLRLHALPIPCGEPVDISNAVLWLASDESRYVTGIAIPVDAGYLIRK